MVEKGYQKHAWILLSLLGVIAIVLALLELAGVDADTTLTQSLLGQSASSFSASSPKAWSAIMWLDKDAGANLLGFGILGLAISFTAYRRGEKWAWYVTWAVPIFLLYTTTHDYVAGGGSWPLFLVFVPVSLAALFLPYRKFFPKK